MIRSFDDNATRDVFDGKASKVARSIDKTIWPVIRRKLDAVNAAATLDDLRSPPGNRLEALKGDQRGRHSIRVNAQYRITFRFASGDAYEVRCGDYH